MGNKEWNIKDGKRLLPTGCTITGMPCIDDNRYCSLCPVEAQGYSYEEASQWLKNKKFDADDIYRNLSLCEADGIILCHVKKQPEGCPPHCDKLKDDVDNE